MSTPYEWRINDIERTANEAKRRLYELDAIRGDVARLECALRESRAETDGLRNECATTRQRLEQLETQLADLMANIQDDQRRSH